ncbi:MAG TPA: transposase [Planctomycetaceae bacterium]|nr:transposase [Planctomycetaceae bacterium]HQZ64420.1 transposase [Planctomycetaceae bacterium]
MAKRKKQSKRPQAQHKPKSPSSQHDKRKRLDTPNPQRRKTAKAKAPLTGAMAVLVTSMAGMLDARMAFRLSIIMAGMMLADDRRVAASWFMAAGVQDDWDRFYDCLISVGRNTRLLAQPLLIAVVRKFAPGPDGHIIVAVDDSPTRRYGRHVEGAGVHHNPTAGPADGEWMYGHNWVSLCFLGTHPLWGVIALPLRSMLYVRAKDVPALAAKYGWEFRTKLELAVSLVTWFVKSVRALDIECKIWLVTDGAYAGRPVLKPLTDLGVVVFSRLRKDACLLDLPPEPKPGQRGPRRIYGFNHISLAKRAAHADGWDSMTYQCRGSMVTREYKTFLATSQLVSGVIRVVIVRFADGGWAAYFCTDAQVDVRDILETIAARWAIEEHFHDVKEIWGAGQQQVRNIWSNIGCWHLNQWMYTLVELCSWDVAKPKLTDRSNRPWDNPDRRPSHADRRSTIAREMLGKQFLACLPKTLNLRKFRTLIRDVISLCT